MAFRGIYFLASAVSPCVTGSHAGICFLAAIRVTTGRTFFETFDGCPKEFFLLKEATGSSWLMQTAAGSGSRMLAVCPLPGISKIAANEGYLTIGFPVLGKDAVSPKVRQMRPRGGSRGCQVFRFNL